MDELIALFSGNRPESVWLYLGIAAAVVVLGLIRSHRGHIIVFANYTDIVCTVASLALPIVLLAILQDRNFSQTAQGVIVLIPILFVAKATFSYNKNILGFLLALFTKFVLVCIYILVLVLVVFLTLSRRRKKYERRSGYSTRLAGKAATGAIGITGVFAMLAGLGLHSPGFVSLSHYLCGVFQENDAIRDNE